MTPMGKPKLVVGDGTKLGAGMHKVRRSLIEAGDVREWRPSKKASKRLAKLKRKLAKKG